MSTKQKPFPLNERERQLLVEALVSAGAETDYLNNNKTKEDLRMYANLLRRLCLFS
jgi:hypothetical protein